MKCSTCEKTSKDLLTKAGNLRIPRGWKAGDAEGEVLCGDCWGKKYVLRAVTIPVVGPLEGPQKNWPVVRKALQAAWADATSFCNWAALEMAKADCVRTPDMKKLPSMPQLYLYPKGRDLFPGLESTTRVALEHTVAAKYRADRYKRIWLRRASAPNFSYPVPLPVPSQNWTIRWLSANEPIPVLSIRLGGQRIELKLRSGHEFRRQLRAIEQLIAGKARACELAIHERRVTASAHRPGIESAVAGGGQKSMSRIMVKLVAWLPRTEYHPKDKTLLVSTMKDAFWGAVVEGTDPWLLHAHHVQRWIVAHSKRLQSLSDDQKFERRRTVKERLPIN